MKLNEVAGVVVWYNPDAQTAIRNIESYINDIAVLYVVDNSDHAVCKDLLSYLNRKSNIEYISLGENKGIAKALNIGAQIALKNGYKWLLTIDQDSLATPDMVIKLYDFAENSSMENIGIIAAQPDTPTRATKKYEGYTTMDSVIASGNLVNLKAYQAVGGFIDKLFIDYVDCVFSLAIRAKGYVIVQVNDAILQHNLGNIMPQSLFGIKMFPTHHNLLRRYYIARNRLYVHSEFKAIFPEFIRFEKRNNLKMWIKTLLYEKNKWAIIKISRRGRKDYQKGIFGKYKA